MAHIVFFASIREKVGMEEMEITIVREMKLSQLISTLIQEGGQAWRPILTSENVKIAINQELVSGDVMVSNSDEVAFFPPVTGG